jgi:hypothetical protein
MEFFGQNTEISLKYHFKFFQNPKFDSSKDEEPQHKFDQVSNLEDETRVKIFETIATRNGQSNTFLEDLKAGRYVQLISALFQENYP